MPKLPPHRIWRSTGTCVAALLWWRGRKGPVPRHLRFDHVRPLTAKERNELIAFVLDLFYNWNVYAEQVWGKDCFTAPATDAADAAR